MRYLPIERCVQCPCNITEEGKHCCLKFVPPRVTGVCSDAIPEWCPLPKLVGGEGKLDGIWIGCGHGVKAVILSDNVVSMAYAIDFIEDNPKELCFECWNKERGL